MGIEALGVVLQHAPEDVKDCIHENEDFPRLKVWFEEVVHPGALLKMMGLNLLHNLGKVSVDLGDIIQDFLPVATQDWKHAGMDIADLLYRLNPVPTNATLELMPEYTEVDLVVLDWLI